MKMYVGLTDRKWFQFLKNNHYQEVNFWRPSDKANFRALEQNDLFLFKLHYPDNYIVGGGFFVKFSVLPIQLAWQAFGKENGRRSLAELEEAIYKYRRLDGSQHPNIEIGCIILTDCFYLEKEEWIPAPQSFTKNIVSGKCFDTSTSEGAQLYDAVVRRLQSQYNSSSAAERYTESITKHRIGQGAFRVAVTDAYHRRCAVSGEKTLPVLQAAHIVPYSEGGENTVNNGILLRSDLHTLYDDGYITIDRDYRINVSPRLHEDFGNGKDYYKYDGRQIILPEKNLNRPDPNALEWHCKHIFLG
jgi:putative restriction endonuclease